MEAQYNAPKSTRSRTLLLSWISFAVVLLYVFFRPNSNSDFVVKKAVAVLNGDSRVTGTVTFAQSSKGGPVTVTGEISDLDANSKRGFHIHALGDATNGCTSSGSHYNPFDKTHGAPSDSERHVGDLGNVQSDGSGTAKFTITDSLISLNGPLSVIGRTVVIHAGTDDLGRGGDDESLKTGNAGGRAACGVIGLAELA